jgi:hypothetical protein
MIDTTFDVYSDTPRSRDPDSHSPTLRRYHKVLWSKPLPDGGAFMLTDTGPTPYLRHTSQRGEFHLSSDAIGHTYRYVRAMSHVISKVPEDELNAFFATCSTIGAYIIFPSQKIDNKVTINGARGMHAQIKDRFDLTLECIRRHYHGINSPLGVVLDRYDAFFKLFGDFPGVYSVLFSSTCGDAIRRFDPLSSSIQRI